jgi:L,D-peptidoglycan transpeptidase YkuD (ErfK/YbiS/YcfS/YnhG family)
MRNENGCKAAHKVLSSSTAVLAETRGYRPDKGFGMPIANINVRAGPGNRARGLLNIEGTVFRCALGKAGVSALKREGDGATPIGGLRILGGYRGSKRRPSLRPGLKLETIRADMGWCDAPADASYNRPVRLPCRASHEKLLRGDGLYDFCIVLDWNIRPRRRNGGSAIFMHLARPGLRPTEGCIAVERCVMLRLLPHLSRRTVIRVLA